ncbi:ribonuclease D [Hansschlegelia quercus]|uniref:Ribonuclease D n=1 Tax=Hansschlegelia quercus TaxID=2528245 RepID=A0A4Q9GJF5_9HYPH|nr:ribonuclease D [Hansschlegelia quercus]TBN54262.1 ribonuclease D [Hansschlegelia quercus]
MTMITSTDALAATCARMARADFVTVDTEFLRETTFWPKLCVVQLADEEGPVVIDALAPGIDLAPLFELMATESVLKVFHSGRQDIEIFHHLSGHVPHPVFDTQVAAMVLGYGDSVSYDQLVQRTTGVALDKSSRFTDWSRRPLSEDQITYAIADVTHLRNVYAKLSADLAKRGRADWLVEEMETLTSPATYAAHPDDAWRRFASRLKKPRDLAVMMEVAAWREREAQGRDVPRSRVLKDDALIEVATRAPRNVEALGSLRAFPKGYERSRAGQEILEAVGRAAERDPATLPQIERDRAGHVANPATVELLKVLLRMIAERNAVAPKIIANVEDLERIAADDEADVAALAGWRRELFGEHALKLKAGTLALAIERGRVVTLDREPGEDGPLPAPRPRRGRGRRPENAVESEPVEG